MKNLINKCYIVPILFITFVFMSSSCDDNPVDSKSENRSPEILSLSVFPDVIGPSDSAIVICNAYDPDGDTLVYDWITDARLRIKDALPGDHRLFNTFNNARIFYPTQSTHDTVWVQCFARDRKGKSDAQILLFIVKKDSLNNMR